MMTRLTSPRCRRMLFSVMLRSAHLRVLIAILAAAAITVAVPLHAAHHHGDDAGSLHAPCAVCQFHAPVGAPDAIQPLIVEPDGFTHFLPAPVAEFQPATRSDIDASRAPPLLLAT